MRRSVRSERGAAAVELALFLPLLAFALAAASFVATLLLDYHSLTDLSESGVRYATRAQLNPETSGVYRFRPTAAEVVAYVEDSAGEQGLEVTSISVSPDPSASFPGTPVTVSVTARLGEGVLGALARNIAEGLPGSFGGGISQPDCEGDSFCLTSTATMREE
jgi:Flp pilus assembly protein TadG